jgi:uncharacterized protein involved in cysteine biosynthesis
MFALVNKMMTTFGRMKKRLKLLEQIQVYHWIFTISLCIILFFLLVKVSAIESNIVNGLLAPKTEYTQNNIHCLKKWE